jgi:hypothetical protein
VSRFVVKSALALVFVVSLSACGGGRSVPGGGATPTPPVTTASLTVTILLPKATSNAARRPAYVSSATQSMKITIGGGTPVVANLTAASPNCTSGASGLSCTVNVPAPVGTDTIAVQLYAQPNAQGP